MLDKNTLSSHDHGHFMKWVTNNIGIDYKWKAHMKHTWSMEDKSRVWTVFCFCLELPFCCMGVEKVRFHCRFIFRQIPGYIYKERLLLEIFHTDNIETATIILKCNKRKRRKNGVLYMSKRIRDLQKGLSLWFYWDNFQAPPLLYTSWFSVPGSWFLVLYSTPFFKKKSI